MGRHLSPAKSGAPLKNREGFINRQRNWVGVGIRKEKKRKRLCTGSGQEYQLKIQKLSKGSFW